jgi:hypothetical protein
MHLTLDICFTARKRAATTPLRSRMAVGLRRAQTLSATALARRRAGELVTQRG